VTPGQVVAYGQSDLPSSLLVIADLSTMWVLADVYEPDVPRVRLGETVSVTLPCCPGERYRGQVAGIGDAIDKESRTLKVRAVVPNRGRLSKRDVRAGQHRHGTRQALVVPQGPSTATAARRSCWSRRRGENTSAGRSPWGRRPMGRSRSSTG